ncbi:MULTISPECIES: hypothetical protein [unclassified Leucobacter]|uniref:hypothetical protein n=1 Tax=unclassified Leucobacter TaxID=2621730 RepID=UPI0030190B2B
MIGQLWSALAALGSGLILLAVAAGASPWLALPLITVAAGEIIWAVVTMRAGRIIAPRTTAIFCTAMIGVAATLLFTRSIGILPFLALVSLHWVTAVCAALQLRLARRRDPPSTPAQAADASAPGAAKFLIVLTAQAMLVAAITTPALADTEAGAAAVPHGTSIHGHH